MPPLKGIDRGIDGEVLKALEESGHGRRLAIVDASYNIPRWAQVVDYHGPSSASAFMGIAKLLPIEGRIGMMVGDPGTPDDQAETDFGKAFDELKRRHQLGSNVLLGINYRLDNQQASNMQDDDPADAKVGFYSLANNETEDTLFVRTRDALPYACVTFVISHSQEPEAS